MHARVTISATSVNVEALTRMLAENGLYLVTVHNGRIVELVKVPRGTPVVDGSPVQAPDGAGDEKPIAPDSAPVAERKRRRLNEMRISPDAVSS